MHKSYTIYDNCTLKENEVLMDKSIYLGFALLELSKIMIYETFYDTLQAYFGQENIQLHYVETDSLVLSVYTIDIIGDLYNLEDLFDSSNSNKDHELFGKKN